ncbi:MAG: dioxygenase [Verrucomicrobiaceae bacterium]|nr:dioxygenase [Verrucomicrobiaceae bacterium]
MSATTISPTLRPDRSTKTICYHLAPDRHLLDGDCDLVDCEHCSPTDAVEALHEIPPCLLGQQHHTTLGYDGLRRVAMMVTPDGGGSFRDQVWESMSTIRAILRQQGEPMALTVQTVFLADADDAPDALRLFEAYYGEEMPLTLFVVHPPCGGSALAIEAWAISTRTVSVGYHGPHLVTVEHDGIRWIHASAGSLGLGRRSAYEQSAEAFESLGKVLSAVDASFRDVARVWLYQGNITEEENGIERYRELNRARTDYFEDTDFRSNPLADAPHGHAIYPASTGIGTLGHGLVTACLALRTDRKDVRLLSLENPGQTSAFDYPKEYSRKSPKFSRAMALRIGDHLTTWISGTASIVNAATVHPGDAARQTEQTLDNIEKLIAPENFARHGWADAGASLRDLAKVRVYVKRPEDYETCRAVCERRLGAIPAIYALADVCRPDLLVEIEGVAFSALPRGVSEIPDH